MNALPIAAAALIAWGYLALARGAFWRASERLDHAPAPSDSPEIVAVIPARNEAATIERVVAGHLGSRYPGQLSVIVVDDLSDDGTAQRARDAFAKAKADPSRTLEVVEPPPLPPGWSGKLWAVHHGLAHAQKIAPGAKYVLLTDADIVLAPDALASLVARSERENLSLASLMARLDARGWGSLLIPAFVYFFQMLYPFPRANDPDGNVAAAAGGVMLARKDALTAIGGVESFKDNLIDDCALARAMKDASPSAKIWIGLADDEATSLRDNQSLTSIWNMVARTAYTQLHYSPLLLAGVVLIMALLFLAPPLIALGWPGVGPFGHGSFRAAFFGVSAWGLMAMTYWPTLKLYERPPWEAALLPVAGVLFTGMTISSASRHWRGEGGRWKDRVYS